VGWLLVAILPLGFMADHALKATGNKVIINDTDYPFGAMNLRSAGHSGQIAWAWENFARGNNLAFMDPDLWVWPGRNAPMGEKVESYWEEIRCALGDIRSYADRIDLASMTPQRDRVVGGGLCLASPGGQYLVFQPSPKGRVDRILKWLVGNSFELNLVPGTYAYEWFDPAAHSVVEARTVTIATRHTFTGAVFLELPCFGVISDSLGYPLWTCHLSNVGLARWGYGTR